MGIYCQIAILSVIFLYSNATFGHGDLHARIQKASKEIENQPDSAYLYLKRGKLYFQHEEVDKSLKDFKQCEQLGFTSTELDYSFANAFKVTGAFNLALNRLDTILAIDSSHVKSYRLKGKIYMQCAEYKKAGYAFEKALHHSRFPVPETFLEISLAWENHEDSKGLNKAIESIELGIERLGTLVVFLNRLVDLHRKNKNYQAAIAYQNEIINQSKRKESAFYTRAQLFLEQGDDRSAKQDLEKVLVIIHQLPTHIKRNNAMKELNDVSKKLLKTLN